MAENPKCDIKKWPDACSIKLRQGEWYCKYNCSHRIEDKTASGRIK